MKYLKIFLGLLLLLVVIFFGNGLLNPSFSYESEITVDKPLREAWAVMNDESKIDQWLEGITDVKHVSGEKGTVGAVTEYTFVQNGQESTVIETIKSIRPDEQIIMDFSSPGAMDMEYTVDMNEQNGKTVVKSSTVTEGQGIIMKSLFSFMKGSFAAQEDQNMSKLKTLINENTTNYFPEPVLSTEIITESQ